MDYGMVIETAGKTYEFGLIESMSLLIGIPVVVLAMGYIISKIDNDLIKSKFNENKLEKILRVK